MCMGGARYMISPIENFGYFDFLFLFYLIAAAKRPGFLTFFFF